jgi:prepilin-type processing-associated H-X9-DG protein
MVVVVTIIVLAVFLLPALMRDRSKSARIRCVSNLKVIGMALRIWTQDNGAPPTQFRTNGFDVPSYANEKQMFIYFQVTSNEVVAPGILHCPVDASRSVATNWTTDLNSSRISYFAGLDTDDSIPSGLLVGDRNIATGAKSRNGLLEITTNQVPAGAPPSVTWTREMHDGVGNVLFADSHVEQLTSTKLCDALRTSGLATNRLVLP